VWLEGRRGVDYRPVALGCSPALSEDSATGTNQAIEAITVEAHPIAAFDRIDTGKARFGKLKWRGGLVLTSPSRHFGGWSGLVVDAEG
jgi:hypothetical protein